MSIRRKIVRKLPLKDNPKLTKLLKDAVKHGEYHNKIFPITDYHDFSYPSCSLEHRKKLDIGSIYINAAICKLCGWFVRSRNRHDYISCRCGALSVDGGSWYAKRSGNPKDYTDVIVLFDIQETEYLNTQKH